MKVVSIKKIPKEPVRCISVDSPDRMFLLDNGVFTKNSVSQRNVILACLLRPERWVLLGIDLKRVELTQYRRFGVSVAAEIEEAVAILRFSSQLMMARYERMEKLGVNNFQDLPTPGQSVMVMIDEAGELLSPAGGKSEEAKEQNALKDEAVMLIGSIARLGRAAGVHLLIATQRPDAKLIPGEIRDNLSTRIGCGTMKSAASSMLFQSASGQRIRSNPKGGMGLQIHGAWAGFLQGFFASEDWLDEYYKRTGKSLPTESMTKMEGVEIKSIETEREGLTDKEALNMWDDVMREIRDIRE